MHKQDWWARSSEFVKSYLSTPCGVEEFGFLNIHRFIFSGIHSVDHRPQVDNDVVNNRKYLRLGEWNNDARILCSAH